MDLELAGKRALVTGSSRGLGKALARVLLREGASVILHGRSAESVSPALEELAPLGQTMAVAGDLATADGADAVIEGALAQGEIDILVNNAGAFSAKRFEEIDDETWLDVIQTNLMSSVRLSRAFLPRMLKRNTGRILFVASESALKPYQFMVHYGATKAAQLNLARGLAERTKGTNVTVNSVVVGPTWTETVREQVGDDNAAAMFGPGKTFDTSLLQRFETDEEVADILAFLCSARTTVINGSAVRAEGGSIRHVGG